MNSNEKENVKFRKNRQARGAVEKWLNDIQDEMVATLKYHLNNDNKQYSDPTKERKNFVLEKKGQIVATVAQIQWCLASENAITEY